MISPLPYIADRVLNRPLLVHPDKAPLVLAILEGRIPIDVAGWHESAQRRIDDMPEAARVVMRGPKPTPQSSRFPGSSIDTDPVTGETRQLPYRRHNGVAMISIVGGLINRGLWVGSVSGEVSYEGIKYQIETAVADPRAHSIILDIESPGGEAIGAFETAAAVRAARDKKPVVAVVNGMAASAAYAIASGATRIVTTPTGLVGSIGVLLIHADYSRQLDQKGITPTLIFAGAHKVDGNPFQPLPDSVRADLQREVDTFMTLFVEGVAAGRVGLSPEAIRATEARTFIGAEAVDVGLADDVGSFESVLADLSSGRVAHSVNGQRRVDTMSANQGGAAGAGTAVASTDQPAAAAAIATVAAAAAAAVAPAADASAARAEGVAEGVRQEAARQAGIDGLAAKMPGHAALVAQMKGDPTVTVEQAAVKLIEANATQGATRLAAISTGVEAAAADVKAAPAATDRPADPAKAAAAVSSHVVAAKAREHIAEQKAKGIVVSAADAVRHVEAQIGQAAV